MENEGLYFTTIFSGGKSNPCSNNFPNTTHIPHNTKHQEQLPKSTAKSLAMSTKPTLAELASQSTKALLHELKHYRCFQGPLDDLSDPYIKMMSTYRAFHNSIVQAIERHDAEAIKLVHEGLIDVVYHKIPWLDVDEFRAWVKLAVLSHPFRQDAGQHLFVAIVQVQARGEFDSLTSKVLAIAGECADMSERTLAPENLIEDPDDLYFFRHKNGIKDVGPSNVTNADGTCLVCTEAFDDTLHVAQKGPCGHIICRMCFQQWLLQCSKIYTCPLCRACVVCGANSCANHGIRTERVRPVSLPSCLDRSLPEKIGKVLHGFDPRWYWSLREITRHNRVVLAYIASLLSNGFDAADPAAMAMIAEREKILTDMKDLIQQMLARWSVLT